MEYKYLNIIINQKITPVSKYRQAIITMIVLERICVLLLLHKNLIYNKNCKDDI